MAPLRWIFLILLWLLLASPALALRCNSDLVRKGDTKFEVIERCGEPVTIEFVGYKLSSAGNRDMLVEHLVYGPMKGSWYYLIEIVGGRVYRIESFR